MEHEIQIEFRVVAVSKNEASSGNMQFLNKDRLKESRSDFTEEEKAAIKAFANPDNAFSLMSEMYFRNQLPWLWT